MSKFVTLVLEPRFNDEYGEYANLPVFNAHGDVVGYTGGEVPETGNPCEFYVMDEEGFPVCHSASENAKLVMKLNAEHLVRQNVERENAKLRELVRDVVLLAGLNGCDVTKMQMHAHGGDWRTIWERMAELGVPGTEADHD